MTPFSWPDLEVQECLGAGRSGTVFRAKLKRPAQGLAQGASLAIKRYKSWVLDEPGFVERLFREVNVGRSIEHPNVLRVFGALMDGDGRPALAMDFHNGSTLDDELRSRRASNTPYGFASTLSILRCVASGTSALHQSGLIHRDLKPANVLVRGDDAIIADFGVVSSASFPEQTTTGAFLGTIRYAAPEYLFGASYDHSIDAYALGCLAFELFTNEVTFGEHQNWARLIAAKHSDDPELSHEQLLQLTSRFGILSTEFIRLVTESAVNRYDRLPLSEFIAAVDSEAWRRPIAFANGEIRQGPFRHDDAFETAKEAVSTLRRSLTKPGRQRLLSILARYYWTSVPNEAVDSTLVDLGGLNSRRTEGLFGQFCS